MLRILLTLSSPNKLLAAEERERAFCKEHIFMTETKHIQNMSRVIHTLQFCLTKNNSLFYLSSTPPPSQALSVLSQAPPLMPTQ